MQPIPLYTNVGLYNPQAPAAAGPKKGFVERVNNVRKAKFDALPLAEKQLALSKRKRSGLISCFCYLFCAGCWGFIAYISWDEMQQEKIYNNALYYWILINIGLYIPHGLFYGWMSAKYSLQDMTSPANYIMVFEGVFSIMGFSGVILLANYQDIPCTDWYLCDDALFEPIVMMVVVRCLYPIIMILVIFIFCCVYCGAKKTIAANAHKCVICVQEMIPNQSDVSKFNCAKKCTFHSHCLVSWTQTNTSCPKCKTQALPPHAAVPGQMPV